jgi:hypothetical protein
MQFIFRFIVGGVIVSLFAGLRGVPKPKSFAGLLGAALSVAFLIWVYVSTDSFFGAGLVSVVRIGTKAVPIGPDGYDACSQLIIQGMPKRSTSIPKRADQKVFCKAICTLPSCSNS